MLGDISRPLLLGRVLRPLLRRRGVATLIGSLLLRPVLPGPLRPLWGVTVRMVVVLVVLVLVDHIWMMLRRRRRSRMMWSVPVHRVPRS